MNDMGKTDPHAMINKNTVTTFSLFDVTKIKSKFQSTFISLLKFIRYDTFSITDSYMITVNFLQNSNSKTCFLNTFR